MLEEREHHDKYLPCEQYLGHLKSEEKPIRASSFLFHSHHSALLSALMQHVFLNLKTNRTAPKPATKYPKPQPPPAIFLRTVGKIYVSLLMLFLKIFRVFLASEFYLFLHLKVWLFFLKSRKASFSLSLVSLSTLYLFSPFYFFALINSISNYL